MKPEDRLKRLIRLMVRLQSDGGVSSTRLAEDLAVSRRTLFRDLRLLKQCGVPCTFDPRTGYSITLQSHFHVTGAEAAALAFLARLTAAHRETPLMNAAGDVVRKLLSQLPSTQRTACCQMMDLIDIEPLCNGASPNGGMISELIEAIEKRHVVEISLDGQTARCTPVRLVLSAEGWTLLAWDIDAGLMRRYELSTPDLQCRIQSNGEAARDQLLPRINRLRERCR